MIKRVLLALSIVMVLVVTQQAVLAATSFTSNTSANDVVAAYKSGISFADYIKPHLKEIPTRMVIYLLSKA